MTSLALDRRDVFRLGVAGVATVAATSLTSCAAVPAANALVTSAWFSEMTAALAAGLLALTAEKTLDPVWSAWEEGFHKTWAAQADEGWRWLTAGSYCGDAVPPSVLFRLSNDESGFNPATGRLIALVNNGQDCVVFEPWAWKALYLFVTDLTASKDGDTLAGYQALCRISLLPNAAVSTSASSDSGRSELLGYKTRNGEVEMNRRTNGDGTTTVQVVATGIPSASDSATTREFIVPEGYSTA